MNLFKKNVIMARSETIIPVFDHSSEPNVGRMPSWVRPSLGTGEAYGETARTIHAGALNTVCEEARCPNQGECWSRGTATFMLLGDTCTRACGFCAVKTGQPAAVDTDEPRRVADAAHAMGLNYVVLTSVNRDELMDGGASIFAATLKALRERNSAIGLEVLTPDFRNWQSEAISEICGVLDDTSCGDPAEALRLVWGHNMETVPSLYRTVRKGSSYERSLRLLELAAARSGVEAKSSLMLGLGESFKEVISVLQDLRSAGVTRLALGQYLRPSRHHLAVKEYIHPDTFASYEKEAKAMGFNWVKAGAMVRSSYHAEE